MKGNVKYVPMGASGGWEKVGKEPVLGAEYGTTFDVCVLRENGLYQMWFSWRNVRLIAYTQSADGIRWELPRAVLTAVPGSDWEGMEVNRPTVVKKDGLYHMWYTGQMFALENQLSRSCIGYATSADGLHWNRRERPVLEPEGGWERYCAMCPHVIWDEEARVWKMWYSAGHMQEADAIGYAESRDGIHWQKHPQNPIFRPDEDAYWEMTKVEACYVLKEPDEYRMFYMGVNGDGNSAIGLARSRDGVTGWERHPDNPILAGTDGLWDWKGTCKASVLRDEHGYQMWYNGSNQYGEQVGYAYHRGLDLFPEAGYTPQRGAAPDFEKAHNYYYHRYNMLKNSCLEGKDNV